MNDRFRALMQDTALRKEFGARLKQLRKQRHWTQKELANKIDICYQLLNKYEGGQHIRPAETLDTTVDYLLLTGNPVEETPLAIANVVRRVEGTPQPVDQQQTNG